MKQEMIEMLVYLCENGFTSAINCCVEQDDAEESDIAPPPLADMIEKRVFKILADKPDSQRIFIGSELEHISAECRSYILLLSNIGVLDHDKREMVIDYLMEITDSRPDFDDLKWSVIMTLCYDPMKETLDSLPETSFVGDLSEAWH